jgi:peptidoglycan/LPS O-acetylase OafA/YrhL
MQTARANTGFLDGLRGLSALWVLSAHCMIWGGWYGLPLPSAKIAVDVFMLLSGFLMALHAHERERREPFTHWRGWAAFYARRVLRLAPVYWLTLLLIALLSDAFLSGYAVLADRLPGLRDDPIYHPRWVELTPANLLVHASLMFGLWPRWSFATMLPDWSLSLEMQFYLALPLLYLALTRLGTLRAAIPLALLSVLVARYLLHLPGPRGIRGLYPEPSLLLLKLPVFLAGMVLYEVAQRQRARWDRIAATGFAVACCGLQRWLYPHYGAETLVLAGCALLIAWLASGGPGVLAGWSRRALDNAFMRFLAELSYPVYLLHGLFLAILGGWLFQRADFLVLPAPQRVLWLWLGVVAGTYAASWLVHQLVELPGIALGRRLASALAQQRTLLAEPARTGPELRSELAADLVGDAAVVAEPALRAEVEPPGVR